MTTIASARIRPSYSDTEQVERDQLVALLEAEKKTYLAKIAPYQKRLQQIDDGASRTLFIHK